MKKYHSFIVYLAIITLFSCGGKKESPQATIEATVEEGLKTTLFEFNDTTRLVPHMSASPTLAINITLPVIDAGKQSITDNINQAIAYTLFESNDNSLVAACGTFADARKKEYAEMLPEYINLRETSSGPLHWFNNYYLITGEAKKGYKGIINYTIYFEEFTGGAHPNSSYTVLNFNPENGEEILLDAIFTPGYETELEKKITESILAQYNASNATELKEKGIEGIYISNNFILDKEEITFIYNKYDIAPYSEGDIFVSLSYDSLKDILKQ